MILAIICMIAGGALIGAGFASGGSWRYLSISSESSWWPFHNESDNFSLGSMFSVTGENRESWSQVVSEKKKVEINTSLGDIEVRKGDQPKVEFQNLYKDYVTIKETGSELEIEVRYPNNLQLNHSNGKIIVYLTQADYELEIENDLGDITVEHLTFQDLNVTSHLGDITLNDVETQECDIKQNSGDITASGNFYHKTEIKNNLGDVKLDIDGNIDDYDYELKSDLGDVKIGDISKSFSGKIESSRGKSNSIKITDNLGDITVRFR